MILVERTDSSFQLAQKFFVLMKYNNKKMFRKYLWRKLNMNLLQLLRGYSFLFMRDLLNFHPIVF